MSEKTGEKAKIRIELPEKKCVPSKCVVIAKREFTEQEK